jgi:hypothetical protein
MTLDKSCPGPDSLSYLEAVLIWAVTIERIDACNPLKKQFEGRINAWNVGEV